MQKAFSKAPASARAFSEDDVRFLTPFITDALRQAAADQEVGFQVHGYPAGLSFSTRSGAGIGSSDPLLSDSTLLETTSGHLFAKERWLYLTVSQFRKRPENPDTINMANRRLPDQTGQADKELRFEPKEALKPDDDRSSWLFGHSPEAVFIIDYQSLAQLPAAQEIPASVPSGSSFPSDGQLNGKDKDKDIKDIREEMKKKDVEIENLKKEMENIRRDIGKPTPKAP